LVTSLTFKAIKISETGVEDWTDAYYQYTAGTNTSNGYLEVSEEDGSFTIDKLPQTEQPLKVQLYAKVNGVYVLVDEDTIYLNTVGPQGAEGTHGDSSVPITAYLRTSQQQYPPKPTGLVDEGVTTSDNWGIFDTTSAPDPTSECPYVFICKGQKVITYNTNNTSTTRYEWGEVELYDAGLFDENAVEIPTSKSYVEFLKLTDFGIKDGLEYGENGNLYINASFIKSGALLIGDEDSVIFYADIEKQTVQIGKFTVDQYGLRDDTGGTVHYGIIGNADENGIVFYAGATNVTGANPKFSVTNSGILKAIDADITGIITATEGYIGEI
jgi:hypothetical protein